MFWTELLFDYFPINKELVLQQMLVRIFFLFSIWFLGFLAYFLDGLLMNYFSDLNVHISFFGTSFLILFGSYFVQKKLGQIIQDFRPMLKFDEKQFQIFSDKLKRFIFSFFPCFFIALIFIFFTGGFRQLQQAFIEGFSLHIIWDLFFNSLGLLFTATAVWMFASIWLTIFALSRQPLDVTLSSKTFVRFRELSLLAIWFSLFYFIGVSIGNITFFTGAQGFSFSEIFLSPYLIFIFIGIIGILIPFYNIHLVLLKTKKQELLRISAESEILINQLDVALNEQKLDQQIDNKIQIMHYRLFNLQIKEKHTIGAKEWPIDITFISRLIVLVLIPIVSRILAMLILS
jgi:hypothetical protein